MRSRASSTRQPNRKGIAPWGCVPRGRGDDSRPLGYWVSQLAWPPWISVCGRVRSVDLNPPFGITSVGVYALIRAGACRRIAGGGLASPQAKDVARRMTVVGLSTAMRRGEMLGLRWQDVELLDAASTFASHTSAAK